MRNDMQERCAASVLTTWLIHGERHLRRMLAEYARHAATMTAHLADHERRIS
jgi:hypothetical protein